MIRLLFSVFMITLMIWAGITLAPMFLTVIGYTLVLMLVFPLKWLGVI